MELYHQNKTLNDIRDSEFFKTLTDRESEVIRELSKGLSNKAIARSLFVHVKTIKFHLSNIYRKLRVKSRFEAIIKYNRTLLESK